MLGWERVRNLLVGGRLIVGSQGAALRQLADGKEVPLSRSQVKPFGEGTVTSLESETILLVGSGEEIDRHLPVATGSGARFKFVVGEVNDDDHRIMAQSGDTFNGNIVINDDGSSVAAFGPPLNSGGIMLNGTTTGGSRVGDWIEVQDLLPGVWLASGVLSSVGAAANPFISE